MELIGIIVIVCSLISLAYAGFLSWRISKAEEGTAKMKEIAKAIKEGAMAFLKREYKSVAIFGIIIAALLAYFINWQTAVTFICGALTSALAGFIGMRIATTANVRTTHEAKSGLAGALKIAFSSGAVMGLSVVGFGLLGITILYYIFDKPQLIYGFAFGASSVALFARVGGGIFTKAADVGADLVGKVEAGIPEDDPRNPAVIADNVGDNVGDVAGMGADLYESYVGAIIAGMVIAVATFPDPMAKLKGVLLCFLLASLGIFASIIGTFFVKAGKGKDPQKSLRAGTTAAALFFIVGALLLSVFWYGSINPFWAILFGLISGLVMGYVAEYYTSGKQIVKIAESAQTGPATVILSGFSTGMKSTVLPLIVIGITILVAYNFVGMFGVALAALGMLSIAGMTVSVDAYGPIADNAGGIAEMSHLGPDVRKITDSLDAAGNTTAAIAKGFAIGSAALTALALFSAYTQVAGMKVIDIMQPQVIAGLFVGGVIPFLFSTQTMQAVGRAAFLVVGEVRRQFKEIKGLMEGQAKADYAKCVDITTTAALKEMVAPGLCAVIIPLFVGIFFGKEALAGLLAGVLITGVPMALLLANAGGAWDNAKKYVEEGNLGGKKTACHAATVIGDTVGDPFKDTSGPALNILIKLITVVSLVFAPLIIYLNQYVGAFLSRFGG